MVEKDPSARLRRAVKDNNLFMVKRLIQRTDMRNPDPGSRRLTSLAWAAALGHEETFEHLLIIGHDDLELSKDSENNTILMVLAELDLGTTSSYKDPDLIGTALRMARLYFERYPFILDWMNIHGKTALHLASLKGNEEMARMLCDFGSDYDLSDNLGNTSLHYASAWGHVPVVQLLIERGCQYNAPNNDGFTASDYAYSYSTKDTLQNTARIQYETNKQNKKVRRHAQAVAARAASINAETHEAPQPVKPADNPSLPKVRDLNSAAARMRSGSGGSRTTSASESAELDGLTTPSYASSHTRIPSHQQQHAQTYQPPSSSNSTFSIPSPAPPTATTTASTNSAVSPIVTRMKERDADAIAEYMKRTRSGSAGTHSTATTTTASPASAIPPVPPLNSTLAKGASFSQRRRLRPSASANQLRSTPPAIVTQPTAGVVGHRGRSGTNPTRPSGDFAQSPPPMTSTLASGGRPPIRRLGTNPERSYNERVIFPEDTIEESDSRSAYQGPSEQYATFPEPPPKPPTKEPDPLVTPTRRAIPFNLLKPLPSIEPGLRGHRRGTSAATLRT